MLKNNPQIVYKEDLHFAGIMGNGKEQRIMENT